MKIKHVIAAASSLALLAGCASAPPVAVFEPVGPSPASQVTATDKGCLQVYSARMGIGERPDLIEWEWDYNLSRTSPAP